MLVFPREFFILAVLLTARILLVNRFVSARRILSNSRGQYFYNLTDANQFITNQAINKAQIENLLFYKKV